MQTALNLADEEDIASNDIAENNSSDGGLFPNLKDIPESELIKKSQDVIKGKMKKNEQAIK